MVASSPRFPVRALVGEAPRWEANPYKPDEALINAALGGIGSNRNPEIRRAVLASLWPGKESTHCGEVMQVRACGQGADWRAECVSTICDSGPQHLAEHKPREAPPHWKPCDPDTWIVAKRSGFIALWDECPWPPPPTCAGIHDWSESCDGFWHGPVNDGTGLRYRLWLPQVVVDGVQHGLPVTIVTDRGSATELYQTWTLGCGFDLNPDWFPVRRTVDLLNDMADAMPHLDGPERREVVRAMTLMWSRVGWEKNYRLSHRAKGFIAGWVEACAERPPKREDQSGQ